MAASGTCQKKSRSLQDNIYYLNYLATDLKELSILITAQFYLWLHSPPKSEGNYFIKNIMQSSRYQFLAIFSRADGEKNPKTIAKFFYFQGGNLRNCLVQEQVNWPTEFPTQKTFMIRIPLDACILTQMICQVPGMCYFINWYHCISRGWQRSVSKPTPTW